MCARPKTRTSSSQIHPIWWPRGTILNSRFSILDFSLTEFSILDFSLTEFLILDFSLTESSILDFSLAGFSILV